MIKVANVRVIPSTINPMTKVKIGCNNKKKVAAYARVSTDSDEQYTSYETQVSYYKRFISQKPEWEYVDVYADEGITGTNTKKRESFNKMINDALDGKIDLIITKSISRFARNTLDTIAITRKLKDNGIEVFFEKENLWTLDSKSELILTIMASIAQEESRSISQNVTIGKRWQMQEGKVSFAYSTFLGYKQENGQIVIDEEQAKIVKEIYRMFLVQGMTATKIADVLNERGVPKAGKSTKWNKVNINSILKNEKYKGDALLQKTYTKNYLEHSVSKNNGELPQYYVKNSHPAIIDRDMWDLVQAEMLRRSSLNMTYSSRSIFATKIICEDCNSFYGRKVWHSNSQYARYIFQCNNKFKKGKEICRTPHFTEEQLKEKFLSIYNKFMLDHEAVISDTEEVIGLLTNCDDIDDRLVEVSSEMEVINQMIKRAIDDNAHNAQSQDDFEKRYNELTKKFESFRNEYENLQGKKSENKCRELKLRAFVDMIKSSPLIIEEWDDELWNVMIERVIVHRNGKLTYIFNNGTEIKE